MVAQIVFTRTHSYTYMLVFIIRIYISKCRRNRLSIARLQKVRRIAIFYSVFIRSKLLHKNDHRRHLISRTAFFFIPSSFLRIIYSLSIHMRTRKWQFLQGNRGSACVTRIYSCIGEFARSPIINYRDFLNGIAQNAVNCPREIHF